MVDYRNAYGAIGLMDGGTPRTMTYLARANISGGYFVNGSSGWSIVSSGADSYATSDIEGFNVATQVGSQVIGLNLQDTASGTYGTVAQRGMFILPVASGTALGSVFSGQKICAGSAGTVVAYMSGLAAPTHDASATFVDFDCGRAMTQGKCDSETQYVIVSLNI